MTLQQFADQELADALEWQQREAAAEASTVLRQRQLEAAGQEDDEELQDKVML